MLALPPRYERTVGFANAVVSLVPTPPRRLSDSCASRGLTVDVPLARTSTFRPPPLPPVDVTCAALPASAGVAGPRYASVRLVSVAVRPTLPPVKRPTLVPS